MKLLQFNMVRLSPLLIICILEMHWSLLVQINGVFWDQEEHLYRDVRSTVWKLYEWTQILIKVSNGSSKEAETWSEK